MKFLKNLLEKRGTWIPWATATQDSFPRRESGNLPAVKRCLQMFRDLAVACPLVVEKSGKQIEDHWLHSLLDRPAPWLNKSAFFTLLCEGYFLSGNFYCYKNAPEGRILNLAPFPAGSCFAYGKTDGTDNPTGDNSDPIGLLRRGWFYQTQFGKKGQEKITKLSSEDVWHIRNLWQGGADQLNGNSLFTAYPEAIDLAGNLLDTCEGYGKSKLVPPSILTGTEAAGADKQQDLRSEIKKLLQGDEWFLTLPSEIKITPAMIQSPGAFLSALSTISSLNIARIFGVPISLLGQEDSNNTDTGVSLKESHRFFVRTTGRGWLKTLELALNELLDEGERIRFLWRHFQFGDIRESQALPPLIEAKILTPQRAKEWLED